MKCPSCKAEIPDESNFCQYCSKKVRRICSCWVKNEPYDCGMSECPGLRLPITEERKKRRLKAKLSKHHTASILNKKGQDRA